MVKKVKIEDKEYDIDNMSDKAKSSILSLQFVTNRIQELTNMQALLQRAKNSYIYDLRREMLSKKSGILFDEN